MAAALRAAGWTVIAPVDPGARIPEPAVGQVWAGPKDRVPKRTVVGIGPHRWWPGQACVFYRLEGGEHAMTLNPKAWRAWAKKSGARPV